MVSYEKFWPSKAFCCLDFDLGTKIFLSLIILIRFICMCLGCLYGPYLYLVLPLGGLYLAADVLLLYTIFGSGLKSLNNDTESQEGKHQTRMVNKRLSKFQLSRSLSEIQLSKVQMSMFMLSKVQLSKVQHSKV